MGSQESRYPPELPATVTVSIGACWRPGASWGRRAEGGVWTEAGGWVGACGTGNRWSLFGATLADCPQCVGGRVCDAALCMAITGGEALPVRLSQSLGSPDSLDVVPRVQLLLWKHLSTLPQAGRGPSSLCREPIAVGHAPVAEFDSGGVGGAVQGRRLAVGPQGAWTKETPPPPSHRPSSPYSPSTRSQ